MARFKTNDTIETIVKGKGFEQATVLGTFISKDRRTKNKEMYLLKIMNGTATIPVSSEVNYQLAKKK